MRSLVYVLLALALLSIGSCLTIAHAAPPAVGMNLPGVTYYDTSHPFLDRMKTASDWEADNGAGPVQIDALGYPLAVPAGAGSVKVMVGIDPVELPTPDRYVLTWRGAGDFGLVAGRIVEKVPGRAVIEAVPGIEALDIRWGGLSAADPLREMHLVREDQVAIFQAGKIFNPALLDRLRPFDTLRMMDWARTNDAARLASWANRPRSALASWSTNAGGGVPLEVQIALANELGRNLWLNIPFTADDDYVARTVQLTKAQLKPGLKLYVEFSNELWNWAFPVAGMAAARGKPDGMDNATYGGFRAAQVAQVARKAWGDDPDRRLRTVLAVQASYPGLTTWHILPGVKRVGEPGAIFTDYAVTTYFYGPLDAHSATGGWAQSVAWAKAGAAGLTAFLADVETRSLPQMEASLAEQAAIARANGLELIAYEGGHHLTANGSGVADDDRAVAAMVEKAVDDPQMGAIYGKMIDGFARQGGTLLTGFALSGKFWGVLPTIYAEGSPRYDALVAANEVAANDNQPATPQERIAARLASAPATSKELIAAGWPAGAPANAATQLTKIIAALRKAQPIESVSVYRRVAAR